MVKIILSRLISIGFILFQLAIIRPIPIRQARTNLVNSGINSLLPSIKNILKTSNEMISNKPAKKAVMIFKSPVPLSAQNSVKLVGIMNINGVDRKILKDR